MSVTSLSAVRLAEAEVCLSRPCRLSVWRRLRCVSHGSLSAVCLVEAVVCLSRIPIGCPSGGG